MNQLLRQILIVVGTLLLSIGANAQNLVTNGSFEAGDSGWTWTGSLSILGPPALPSLGVDGAHCASLGGGDIANSTLSQSFSLVPDTAYVLSMATAAGGDGFAGRTGIILVEVIETGGKVLASQSFTNVSPGPLIGTNGFIKRVIRFGTSTNAAAVTVRITDVSPNGGVAVDPMIDNVILDRLPLRATLRVSEVEVCWETVPNKTYQVQYRSVLPTNPWIDVGSPIQGNGTTNCIKDSVPIGEPQRFYRVTTVP